MSNSGVPDMLLTWHFWTVLLYMCVHSDHRHRAEWTSLVCNRLLKKITNYWHLNFLLLIASKRGWHLCKRHKTFKKLKKLYSYSNKIRFIGIILLVKFYMFTYKCILCFNLLSIEMKISWSGPPSPSHGIINV
jgi:hypothetical protein